MVPPMSLRHLYRWLAVPAVIAVALGALLGGFIIRDIVASEWFAATRRPLPASIDNGIWITGLILGPAVAAVVLWLPLRVVRGLSRLQKCVIRLAHGTGDTAISIPNTSFVEIRGLADAITEMSERLRERSEELSAQETLQGAILAAMVEGVLAVDDDETLIGLNSAAANLLRLDPEAAVGKPIAEVIHHPGLHRFIARALTRRTPLVEDIRLHAGEGLDLEATGTQLDDACGIPGVLIVLHDVTRLRNLERAQRDFVGNVSHELRTPLTSIRGFAETLATAGFEDHARSQRFTQIILRHVTRLNDLIDDLLSLSELERESAASELAFTDRPIEPIVRAAAAEAGARHSGRTIRVDVDSDLHAFVNSRLVEQALVNLIDNGLKYSGEEMPVEVWTDVRGEEVAILVRDYGQGISERNRGRVFERFFRVDRARSRKVGGTGLGLAIVRRVADVHGGRADLTSELGQGSTFEFTLPRTEAQARLQRGRGPAGTDTSASGRITARKPILLPDRHADRPVMNPAGLREPRSTSATAPRRTDINGRGASGPGYAG
jgi:two-component system phosphate regulon sensor histidine kinase PhoR